MTDLAEFGSALGKPGLQRRQAGGRTAVEERRAVVRLDEVATDASPYPTVEEIDG